MTSLLVCLAALTAVEAPVTSVTVFTDQARVVRTAQLTLAGAQAVELPPLRQGVDLSSIRVEAQGAEVRRVDIQQLQPSALRTDEARAFIAELDKVDAELTRLSGERAALNEQRVALERLGPTEPVAEVLKPAPRLTPASWPVAVQFATEQLAKTQQKLREVDQVAKKLNEKRALLADKGNKLNNPVTATGYKVTAQLVGSGPATLTLTYVVGQARWLPSWDLQLAPETSLVTLSLAGLVSQETGEDWPQAALTLSTAIPFGAVPVPVLKTWKIGTTDRFIPTATPVTERVTPPPPVPRPVVVETESGLSSQQFKEKLSNAPPAPPMIASPEPRDELRSRNLVERAPSTPAPAAAPMPSEKEYSRRAPVDFDESAIEGDVAKAEGLYATASVTVSTSGRQEPRIAEAQFSLSPPGAWRAPMYGPDTPIALAGGYDLSFASLQKESVPTAQGTRRVALWSQKWPVTVERKLFPALSKEAYLVAELKNPSQQVLPGGPAQLFVGADPAGSARLKLVSPGEAFTLPLGIDRAVKSIRNIQVVEATQGLVSKDEVSTYSVSIEVVNPYPTAISVRVYDQWPLTTSKNVETTLIDSKPGAIQDALNGGLEWRLSIAPNQKQVITFSYRIKRPQGWQLSQSETSR